jgi:hypothetical protein
MELSASPGMQAAVVVSPSHGKTAGAAGVWQVQEMGSQVRPGKQLKFWGSVQTPSLPFGEPKSSSQLAPTPLLSTQVPISAGLPTTKSQRLVPPPLQLQA